MRSDRRRLPVALLAIVTVVLGLLSRADLPLPAPVVAYGGDTLYATLAFFLVALLRPGWPAWRIGLLALVACFAIELGQLIRTPWLDALRRTLPGRLVLGSGFLPSDLACYAAGVLLGATVDRLARSIGPADPPAPAR